MTVRLLDSALWYAKRGWPVIPLYNPLEGRCSCRRTNCNSPAKHPRTISGLKDASIDPEQIGKWWALWPDANVGVVTGAEVGFIALDIDPKDGGQYSLEALESQHGPLPGTVEAETGSGGRHLLFHHPGGTIGNRAHIRPGVDTRADGGYIVAPPSLHASGRRYVWMDGHGPHEISIALTPAWLLSLITGPGNGKATSAKDWRALAADGVSEGARNDTIARLSGHLLRRYVDPKMALDLILAWNASRCRPPLPEEEVVRTVDSICAKELRRREAKA